MKTKITWRVWFMLFVLVLALIAVAPSFKKGALVLEVEKNSTAAISGIQNNEIITSVNGKQVTSIQDYADVVEKLSDQQAKVIIQTDKEEYIFLSTRELGITVTEIPKTKIKTGLDLRGGSRALVKPERQISEQELEDLISITENRLNLYGISDIKIRSASDLGGEKFMLIEVAGASKQNLRELVSRQGKFEARIGNDTVFIGGKRDITFVCRNDPSCAAVRSCQQANSGYVCQFDFVIYLSQDAAKRHAEITKEISVNRTAQGNYLSKTLDLFLDDQHVDSLLIAESLRGVETQQISVSGSGQGPSQEDAIKDTEQNMKNLQTIMITGSLPFKLEIVKLDTVSSVVGAEVTRNVLLISLLGFVVVLIILFARYRRIKIVLLMFFTLIAEIVIVLGVAATIKWNIDLPSIAGIIASIGTGVDDQIVILDEARSARAYTWKERLKRAFFIVMGAYATNAVAMLPLLWAGAGLLKGFAFTALLGISIGVFITRPAYADIITQQEN